jgi:hypothetical protein
MRICIVTLAAAIAATNAADAGSEVVIMNAIDATPMASARRLARFSCPTPKRAYRSSQRSSACRQATADFMSTLIRTVAPGLDRTASQRLGWQRVAITTRLILADTLDPMARATGATCQC